jgi:predicted amidohydrolase
MKNIRIALIIFNAPVGEIDKNLDRMNDWVEKAKQKDAQLVCFPELNVSGYSTRSDIQIPSEADFGKTTACLRAMAKKESITLLAGMMEKKKNDTLFASHMVVKPKGSLGIYRKLHIAPPEKHLFSQGDEIPLFEDNGAKFGIQLCYDAHFPELSTRMAANGAEMIFIPHASPKGTPDKKYRSWLRHLKARAYDNSIFILALNQVGDNHKGLTFPGVAVVVGPGGEVLDKKLCDKEGMLLIDLKKKDLDAVRSNRMHFFLPNRRKDLFNGS